MAACGPSSRCTNGRLTNLLQIRGSYGIAFNLRRSLRKLGTAGRLDARQQPGRCNTTIRCSSSARSRLLRRSRRTHGDHVEIRKHHVFGRIEILVRNVAAADDRRYAIGRD